MLDATEDSLVVRPWARADRDAVQGLLRLLSSQAELAGQEAPTYVAVIGNRIVGMVTLCVFRTLTGPKALLDHLVVAPDARRRGIGRALVHHAVAQARAAGATRVDLTANEQKRAGRALYQALGFRKRDTGVFRLSL